MAFCMYGTSWTKKTPLVILSLVLVVLFVLPCLQIPQIPAPTAHPRSESEVAALKETRSAVPARVPSTGSGLESISSETAATSPQVNWDEQLGLTITQNRAALAYNISAVEQTDTDGYGPGYILNGLGNTGDWYQVGLAYDWPVEGGGFAAGFSFLYESFNSSGVSVFPSNGGGGLLNYSGVVNEGDKLLLSLNFTGAQVVMYSRDWNTGATASVNYTAQGATIFDGLQTANNPNGYFSGLMTEQYHAQPYFGQEGAETYVNSEVGLNFGIMWIDEYNPNTNQTLFNGTTAEIPYGDPTQLQYYSLNGTSEASDAYEFITGSNVLIPVTLSYSIVGGGSGYVSPTLNYTSNGQQINTSLTGTPIIYLVDQGTTWNATGLLSGSSTNQRWIASQTNGTASQTITIQLVYTHEYFVGFNVTPADGGILSPSTSGWYQAGSSVGLIGTPKSPFLFSGWVANSTRIQFANFMSANTTTVINGAGGITAKFSLLTLSLSSYSDIVIDGGSVSGLASITGNDENVTLSISGLPLGATAYWTSDSVDIGNSSVNDAFNISISFATPSGIYTVTVTAASQNSTDSVQFSLNVALADPLTVSFSVNDNSFVSAPTLEYIYNGTNEELALSQIPQTVYVDNGSSWSINSTLGSATSQRWIAYTGTQGTASGAATIEVVYYHQYLIEFTFGSSNSVTSEVGVPSPSVSYTAGGQPGNTLANGTEIWADSGTAYNYSSFITISSTYRWEISGNQTGTISKTLTTEADYTPQYLVNISYALAGRPGPGTGSSPQLSVSGNGSTITVPLSLNAADYWMNDGASWSASSNMSGGALERWLGSDLTGIVNSSAPIKPTYLAQFFVTINQNVASAGSVTGNGGWYDANSTIPLSAVANQGWQFEMWTGGGSTINQSSTGLDVSGPINETAVFFASLSISPASGGHVSYSYGSMSGTVSGGSSTTLYLAPGTNVSLSAAADSSFYAPGSWSASNDSSSSGSSLVLSVESPTSVGVSFSLNLTIIALIGAAAAGVLVSIVFVVLRRGGAHNVSGGVAHTWKW